MTAIKCVENFYRKMNVRTGLMQDIIEYSCKDGTKGTEVTTYLNKKGNKITIRDIKKDTFGKPIQIVDHLMGNKVEIYKPTGIDKGVQKLVGGKVQCYYPDLTLNRFINY